MKPNELRWLQEPAKMVGRYIAVAIVLLVLLVEILNEVASVLPEGWQVPIRSAVIAIGILGAALTQVQAVLTRNGFGPKGNGKDGVYSPWTVMNDPSLPALEGTRPGGTSQGGPQEIDEIAELKNILGITDEVEAADPSEAGQQ